MLFLQIALFCYTGFQKCDSSKYDNHEMLVCTSCISLLVRNDEWWCKDLSLQDVYINHSLTHFVSWKNAFKIDAAQKVNNDNFQKQWSTTSFSLDDCIKAITTAIKTISIKTTYRPLWNVFARKIGLVLPVSGPRMWGSRMALARGLIKCWH